MPLLSEAKWRKYKADFLAANQCTDDEFEAAYIAFMELNNKRPNAKAYRHFARKYSITIQPEPGLPEDVRLALSVNISAAKVMAKTFAESEAFIQDLLSDIDRRKGC